MAQLYADENFPFPVIMELRRLGHDVLTALEAGQAHQSISDDEVLAFATRSCLAILTLNRKHFFRLHAHSDQHSGIVACTFDPDFVGQAERIDAALLETPEIAGKVLRVNRLQG